jgi:signal transduction histidine kinase
VSEGPRNLWLTLVTGTALAVLALGLGLWSKELTKEARRAECSARAQTIALHVRQRLEQRLRVSGGGDLVRARWTVRAGEVRAGEAGAGDSAADPPPADWIAALAKHEGASPLSLSQPGGVRAATFLPRGPQHGELVEWDLVRVQAEVIGPALAEASEGRYASVLLVRGQPEPTEFRARAQSPLFPPLGHWSVGVGFADRSAVSRDLRIQTGLLSVLVIGLLGTLVASVLASARRSRRRAQRVLIRDQFLARATHELQTPLALLRAAAETLERGAAAEPADRERCLAIVLREEGRLTTTIRRLLRTLRWESGEAADLARWGPPAAAVEEAAELLRAPLSEAGIQLSLEVAQLSGEAPVDLLSDTVTELLSNALKHAQGASGVRVALSAEAGRALLEVGDDGPGLATPDLAFQPFRQAEGATPGSGLGLALLHEGWTLLGGKISVEGPGARFRVEVPLREG